VVFDPASKNPVLNYVMTIIFLGQIPWLFANVLQTETQRYTLGAYLVLVTMGILLCDQLSLRFADWISNGPLSGPPFNNPLKMPEMRKPREKFKCQSWQLVLHVFLGSLELWAMFQMKGDAPAGATEMEQKVYGLDIMKDGWANIMVGDPNLPIVETIYLVQMAIWVVTAIFHVFVFERQMDYFVMLAHHLATLGLIGVSFQFNFCRYGLMVLFIHDLTDIWIDLLKMFNYLKLEGKAGFFLLEGVFASNLICWMYFRIYVLSTHIIHGSVYKSITCVHAIVAKQNGAQAIAAGNCFDDAALNDKIMAHVENWIGKNGWEVPYSPLFIAAYSTIVLLTVLWFMHIYWFALFIRLLIKIVSEGDLHEAGRTEYEGEDHDTDAKKSDNKKD